MDNAGTTAPQWEYKFVTSAELLVRDGKLASVVGREQNFNDLGRDGWELAAVDTSTCIFKRPLTADA